MIRKKVFGAAPFGVLLLLGAPLAMAQISPGQTTESAPINYANETLAKKDDDDRHPTRYVVEDDTGGDVIDIVVPINVGTLPTGTDLDDSTVVFTLHGGMEFGADLADNSLNGGGGHIVRDGDQGDSRVEYMMDTLAATDNVVTLTLEVTAFQLPSMGTGGVTVELFKSAVVSRSVTIQPAVQLMIGLTEEVDPRMVTADADTEFTTVMPGGTVISLGTLQIGYNDELRHAQNGALLTELNQIMSDSDSMISITGDFSFVEKAALVRHGSTATAPYTCQASHATIPEGRARTGTTLSATELRDYHISETIPEAASSQGAIMQLCLYVDGDTTIVPGEYVAMIEYEESEGDPDADPAVPLASAFAPESGQGSWSLGSIAYGTSDVQIPFVTPQDRFNQRIMLVNRSGTNASYRFAFRTESGATAMPLAGAMGMLAPNSVTTLHVRNDVVEVTGSPERASATIHIDAPDSMIDVIVTQIDPMTGALDTTYPHRH
jgi:hypothetical protein